MDFDLDDLLAEGPVKKTQAQKAPSKRGGKSPLDDDFYSNLAAQAGDEADSEVSDVDAGQMAKTLGGLDDMDADLFGGQLPKKKGSIKSGSGRSGKQTTPRRTPRTPRSNSNTPRGASGKSGSQQRNVSPTRSESPTSPRGFKGKRTPSKPSSPPPQITTPKPGTAPGKMTDIYTPADNMKPGQGKTEEERPRTTPKSKPKFDFGEFDEDDPLAGLGLSDDESFGGKKKSSRASPVKQQKSVEEKPAPPPQATPAEPQSPVKDLESPRRRSLFDRPPTRSGSGKSDNGDEPAKSEPAKPKPAIKKKDEVIFSDEDDFLLGLEEKPAKPVQAARPRSADLEDSQRSAKSFMDGLLGKGTASKELEVKDTKKQFVLDNKYTKGGGSSGDKDEDDFLFGSYQPSAASGSRPGSRRSVRFQDDDLFGSDRPPSRGGSGGSGAKKDPDGMDWLEMASDKPSQPSKGPPSPTKEKPEVKSPEKAKASPADWLGLKGGDAESSEEEFFRPKRTPQPSTQMGRRPLPKSETKKESADDWLGLTDKKTEPEKKDVAKPPVASANVGAKKNDAYLGLGDEVDLDDPFKRLDAPGFPGKSSSPFNRDESKNTDLFSPPASRETRSGGIWDAKTRSSKSPEVDIDNTFPSSRGARSAAAAAFARSLSVEDELDAGPPVPSAGQPILSQVYQQQPKKDVTQYSGPVREHGAVEPLPEPIRKAPAVSAGQGYSQSMKDFLDEPIRPVNQSLAPQVDIPGPQHQQEALLQQQAQLQRMMQDLQAQYAGSMQSTPSIPALSSSLPSQPAYSTVGSRLDDLPASLQEAQARIRKLEIEKHYAESLLDSTRRRYDEEIAAIESSYKNRMEILDDSHRKKETRLRDENENLMSEHLSRVRKLEQEKADIASQNYRNLEDLERTKAAEMEKLRDSHRSAIGEIKREQEEMVERMKKAKTLEIEAVASAHDTSKSLTAVVEQIQNNAKDLGQLQHKVDSWHRQGLDDREISLKSKDEQLRILQERLSRQEADNENERKRLEDLITRMETQLRDQGRLLDEERWKLRQEHGRVEAQQKSLEEERRVWVEQQARERDMIERARSSFLEEQRSSMNQINEERRALAEQRTKFNVDQKMMRERMNHDTIKAAQAEAEYEVLVKSIAEERAKSSQRQQELKREEERMDGERMRMEREKAKIDAEGQRLTDMASQVKHKSSEVESMSEMASRSRRDGERALIDAQQIESQHNQRLEEINRQIQILKNTEEHIGEEKLRLAKEKKDVDNLKSSSLCTNCRTPVRPGDSNMVPAHMPLSVAAPMMSPINGARTPMQMHGGNMMHHGNSSYNLSFNAIESITTSIAADRSVRMWKIQALKDKEYLEEETMFLESLKHSPYHSYSQKI